MTTTNIYNVNQLSELDKTENNHAKVRPIISLILNGVIVALFIVGIIYTAIVSKPDEIVYAYFSFVSAAIITLSSILAIIFTALYMLKKREVPYWVHIIRLSTAGMAASTLFVFNFMFIVGVFILQSSQVPIKPETYNIFYMFLMPLITMVTFMFFEHHNPVKFAHTTWSLIPIVLYLIGYIVYAAKQCNSDGIISFDVDFYLLFYYGGEHVFIMLLGIFSFQFLSTVLIRFINQKFQPWPSNIKV